MVKAIYSVNHKGLFDWLMQHISAFIMVIYTLGMLGFLITHTPITYFDWHQLFVQSWVKIASLIVFILLLCHAWIGIWTIITDYIKCAGLRLACIVFVGLALATFFMFALFILWGLN